jgi:CheY-like chemotaxis protein
MGFTILIVDDSKLARMSMAKALTELRPDWTRVEATNADEALALAKSSRLDMAVLDFNMPGRDGLSLATDIRAIAPDMPLAIISANHQTEVVSRTKAVGATFLAKPLAQEALAAFLDSALQQLKSASA